MHLRSLSSNNLMASAVRKCHIAGKYQAACLSYRRHADGRAGT
jgi:hypothetical protein